MLDSDTVHVEEEESREQSGPLVPVDERVVLDDVEQVRGRHLEEPLVRELAAERRPWLCDGRLQQPSITQPGRTAVDFELARVDLEDVVDVEDDRLAAHLASFRSVSSWTAIIFLVDARTRAFFVSFAGMAQRTSSG